MYGFVDMGFEPYLAAIAAFPKMWFGKSEANDFSLTCE